MERQSSRGDPRNAEGYETPQRFMEQIQRRVQSLGILRELKGHPETDLCGSGYGTPDRKSVLSPEPLLKEETSLNELHAV
jgi:hypothetical protein